VASQGDLRRRITAVRNTRQITRAMQFVAASKLKHAQEADLAARPYDQVMDEVLADLAAVLDARDNPLLARRPGSDRLLVVLTTDRGLCGPLNTNVVRATLREVLDDPGTVSVVTVGRKGRDALRRARVPIVAHFAAYGDRPSFGDVIPLARLVADDYLAETYSRIDLVYPRFVSTLVQRPVVEPLLPIQPAADTHGIPGRQFIFEPDPATVLARLLPRYVATSIFQAVLETTASEMSSKMVAMKNATENAEELIDELTLSYNKVRQANITREMIEIASGSRTRA
jgi:F-type H+-transporting ATPase subunit gamma